MPNIEIKAVCPNITLAKETAQKLHTEYVGILHQIDTYFNTQDGRLKLREINNSEAQLIPYYKEYTKGPMKSMYSVLPSEDPKTLKHILDKTLGTLTVVDKKREVYLIDNIRVHLDYVKDLGEFIEFEAVYTNPIDEEKEFEKVRKLKRTFNIQDDHLLDKSYIDYLLQRSCDLFLKTVYRFSNNDYILGEFKRTDLTSDIPKEKRFFWFLFDKKSKKLQRLSFLNMDSYDSFEIRNFNEAKLRFNMDTADLVIENETTKLHSDTEINTDFNASLLQYFSRNSLQ